MLKVDRAVEGCFHRGEIDTISSSSEIPVSLLYHFAHYFYMSVHVLASQVFFQFVVGTQQTKRSICGFQSRRRNSLLLFQIYPIVYWCPLWRVFRPRYYFQSDLQDWILKWFYLSKFTLSARSLLWTRKESSPLSTNLILVG